MAPGHNTRRLFSRKACFVAPHVADVTLICTIFNESKGLPQFLDSVEGQSMWPGEVIVVDGGSTDNSVAILHEYKLRWGDSLPLNIIVDERCNLKYHPGPIALGRNIAVRAARWEIIVSTDAGCVLDPDWLRNITGPFRADPTCAAVGGWFKIAAETYFDRSLSLVWDIPAGMVDERNFIPSSRSFAFTKSSWERVFGYPETDIAGEDTEFVINLRNAGFLIIYRPDAMVSWRTSRTFGSMLRLVRKYSFGDGYNRLRRDGLFKNFVKVALGMLFAGTAIFVHWSFLIAVLLYWSAIVLLKYRNQLNIGMLTVLPYAIVIKIASDTGYIIGYIRGAIARMNARRA